MILGEKTKLANNVSLAVNRSYPYTGEWVHQKSGKKYTSNSEFLSNVTEAGTYARVKIGNQIQGFSRSLELPEVVETPSTINSVSVEEQKVDTMATNAKNATNNQKTKEVSDTEAKIPSEPLLELDWTWDEKEQIVTVGEGNLRNTTKEQNLVSLLEKDTRLNGKKIIFTEIIELGGKMDYLFSELTELEEIERLDKLKTEKVTSMEAMFAKTMTLKVLDLATWNFTKVENMKELFLKTAKLETLTLAEGTNLGEEHQLLEQTNIIYIKK